MRLPSFLRTTSFRLTLLYAAFFFASVLVLFAAMYWYGTGFIAEQIDTTVSDEIAELRIHTGSDKLAALRATVATYSSQASSGMFYLLQDSAGHRLAGNLPVLSPVAGVRSWRSREEGGVPPVGSQGIRGRGIALEQGAYLFVGVDSNQLDEMKEMVARAFLWGLGLTLLLSLAGGVVTSLGLLRRVEAVSQASREIMAGDLTRRLPVRGSDDEFDHLAISLNAMLERIETLMAGLREVSSDIAHDLRTPLARLRQRLERASRKALSPEDSQIVLSESIGDVDAILDTFAAVLRIAQIESWSIAAAFETVDLTALLSELADDYRFVAESRGQLVQAQIESGLAIQGDHELLVQMFANLVENAIRHCPSSSLIRIEACAKDDGVEVVIADTGPGIPADKRDKVFQRFYRLENSRTTEGTGLGLSLVSAVIGLHRAEIQLFDNTPGLRVVLRFHRLANRIAQETLR